MEAKNNQVRRPKKIHEQARMEALEEEFNKKSKKLDKQVNEGEIEPYAYRQALIDAVYRMTGEQGFWNEDSYPNLYTESYVFVFDEEERCFKIRKNEE